MGLDWESHGHWDEPFFFVQIADPQLGMVKADGPVGGAVWDVRKVGRGCVAGFVLCSAFSVQRYCCCRRRVFKPFQSPFSICAAYRQRSPFLIS